MSSILDALKKSERQRSLGRDLIFHNAPPDTRPRFTWLALAVGAALFMLVVAIGVLVFNLLHTRSAESGAPPVTSLQDSSPSTAPATPIYVPSLRVDTAQDLLDQARRAPRPSASKLPTTSPPEVGALQSDEAPWLNSLSEVFRSSLPPLEVNIHVYSPVESQRILYINNRSVQQGERIQAGVMVEEIAQDGVVLRFRGQRFKLPRPS